MNRARFFGSAMVWACSLAWAQPSSPLDSGAQGAEATDPEELEQAFGTAKPGKSTSLMDGVPPPHKTISHSEPVSPEDQQFNLDFKQAKQKLLSKDLESASQAARDLVQAAQKLRPAMQQEAFELSYQVAIAMGDAHGAQRAAEQWLLACGPDHVKSCRQKALAALDGHGTAHKRVSEIRRNDQCIEDAEASMQSTAPKLGSCFTRALSAIRRERDRLMWGRALLVQALIANRGEDSAKTKLARLGQALVACNEERCAEIQRRVFHEQLALYQGLDDFSSAAKAALKEMDLAASVSAGDKKIYARTADVDRACDALELHEGAGACRRLEKSLLGHYAFHDFSRHSASGPGLPAEQVKHVNEHFGVTLEECWTAAALTLAPHDQQTYRVSWTVLNDGRVDSPKLERKDQNEGPLGQCIRRQFEVWRYPKYRGEWQHVEQEFRVEAR